MGIGLCDQKDPSRKETGKNLKGYYLMIQIVIKRKVILKLQALFVKHFLHDLPLILRRTKLDRDDKEIRIASSVRMVPLP